MTDDDLRLLRTVGTETAVPAGHVLIERGQPGSGLYVILDGTVTVEAPEGTRDLASGAVIGERALAADDGLRSARVQARTAVRVLAVTRGDFERLCAGDPGLAERVARSS